MVTVLHRSSLSLTRNSRGVESSAGGGGGRKVKQSKISEKIIKSP